MSNFLGPNYVPLYQVDYYKLPWYEQVSITYVNDLKYKEMTRDLDNYFKNKQVINFDFINHQCRGDQLKKSEKEHKTIENNNFNNYPKNEKKKKVMSSVFRNKRDDLWVKSDLMIERFKQNF